MDSKRTRTHRRESGWSRILSTPRWFPFVRQIDDASRDTSSNGLEKTTHAFTPRVPIASPRWHCPRGTSSASPFLAFSPSIDVRGAVPFRFRLLPSSSFPNSPSSSSSSRLSFIHVTRGHNSSFSSFSF